MTKPIDPAAFDNGQPVPAPDAPLSPEAAPATDRAPSDPAAPRDTASPTAAPLDFTPADTSARKDGWTAVRQRIFIATLAETGSVAEACEEAGVTPRSAYRLRLRPGAEGFAAAWGRAQVLGIQRLTAIAFDRAITGTPRAIRKDGRCIGEEYIPSERLLMFLLKHYDQQRYGNLSGLLPVRVPNPVEVAQEELPKLVEGLVDHAKPENPDVHESMTWLWWAE